MSLFNRVACEKEIEIAGMKLESNIANIIALNNIDTFYEASENKKSFGQKMKEATSKIIAEVKKFFNKIKESIAKKYKELKRAIDIRRLEQMWKNNINNMVTITDYADEKRIRKLYAEGLSIGRKYTDKIIKCGDDIARVEALSTEAKQKLEKLDGEVDKLRTTIKFNLRDNIGKIEEFDRSIDDLDNLLADAISSIERKYVEGIEPATEEAFDEGETVNPGKIATFIHGIQAKLVSIAKKVANVFSRNKTKLMSALSSAGKKSESMSKK